MMSAVTQSALREHRAHPMADPVCQLRSSGGIGEHLNAEADFGEDEHADVERFKGLCGDELHHLQIRFGTS